MKRLPLFAILFYLLIQPGFAQDLPIGAEAAGLGNASVNLKGRAAVFANPAGLIFTKQHEVMAGIENRFGLADGLLSMHAAYLHRLARTGLGLSVYRLGDELFSQHQLALNFSQQVGAFTFGARLRQHQYSGEGIETHFAMAIDLGGMFLISDALQYGLLIRNINQASFSNGLTDQLPTSLQTGLSYLPDDRLCLHANLLYELEAQPLLQIGMGYRALEPLQIRSGLNTGSNPLYFFGLGFNHTVLTIDYSLEWHSRLGISQQLGLSYKLKKHEK
jgi:hypothetical protein